MWLVFSFFILILGIVFSNLEISLNNINITKEKYNFKINISLKLFGFLKVLSAKLDRFGLKIFGKKVPISKEKIKKLDKESFKLLENLDLKRVDFILKIGMLDISLTNIAVVLFSTIFPFLINRKIERRNVRYEVLPEYNKICLYFKGKIIVKVKFLKLIEFYFKNKKIETTNNKNKIMV